MSTTIQSPPRPPAREDLAAIFQRPGLPDHVSAGTVAIESERAVAEAQAKLVLAKRFPRDETLCSARMLRACQRITLAEVAFYSYSRGKGAKVTGPSIRLAEELGRCWGNFEYGLRELSRRPGESEMLAFAWDMETNLLSSHHFTVRHLRDKTEGQVELSSERDIYEALANQGARRMRARILAVLPAWYVDDAVSDCMRTIESGGGELFEDRLKKMVAAFAAIGVSAEMLAARLKHPIDRTTPDELIDLRGVMTSIKEGATKIADWFQWPFVLPENYVPHTQTNSAAANSAQHSSEPDTKSGNAEDPGRSESNGSQSEAVELFVADEIGDVIAGEDGQPLSFSDPAEFATFIVNRWTSSDNREALIENNADAIEEARAASPAAAEILEQVVPETETAPSWLVEVPKQRSGKPDVAKYLGALKEILQTVRGAEDMAAFVDQNQPTWTTTSAATNAAIRKSVLDRCSTLAIPDPFPIPPHAPEQADSTNQASGAVKPSVSQKTKEGLLKDLAACDTAEAFAILRERGLLDQRLSRLTDEDRGEVRMVLAALESRFPQPTPDTGK